MILQNRYYLTLDPKRIWIADAYDQNLLNSTWKLDEDCMLAVASVRLWTGLTFDSSRAQRASYA